MAWGKEHDKALSTLLILLDFNFFVCISLVGMDNFYRYDFHLKKIAETFKIMSML